MQPNQIVFETTRIKFKNSDNIEEDNEDQTKE